jgi:uncharacterized SAM-binding protein YcdF (DUF218 family)
VVRRVVSFCAGAVAVFLAVVGVTGYHLFTHAAEGDVQRADAVVVLGGEHDGREDYGITLARQLGARTVLMSNPYEADDSVMKAKCGTRVAGVDVICRRPSPADTRGEAMMAREVGRELGWQHIVVVTWRFHLLRAQIIFSQCYSDDGRDVTMKAVPRRYDYPFALWEFVYLYQYAGLAKALVQGSCG